MRLICSILFGVFFASTAGAFSIVDPSMSPQRNTCTTTLRSAAATAVDVSAEPTLPALPANAKRIFWVRHGEVINPGGDRPVYYGAQDVPLSPLGELEAQAAGEYLKQFPLSKVFSSPLKRAVYGAEQVLKLQSKNSRDSQDEVIQIAGFKELDRGAWCGRTKNEIGPENLARFDACDESVTPEGGESYPALKQRVLEARDEALSKLEPGEIGCVVSHLQVTRSVLSDAIGIPTEKMTGLNIATASVTCMDYAVNTDGSKEEIQETTVHFQSFKPDAGLAESADGAN